MHICFLCDEYPPPQRGGIGSMNQTLARALVAAGHRVSVVGVDSTISERRETLDAGVRVVRVPHTTIPRAGLAVNGFRVRRALADIHREQPIDVVEGPESAFARLSKRAPWVGVIRMHGGHHFFSTSLGDRPRFPRAWLERRSFARADALAAVSQFVADTTRTLLSLDGRRPIEVLPNPIDLSVFRPQDAAVERPDSILFVGTLCEKKGIRQLLQAMPAIVRAIPGARLDIVGPDRRDVEGSFRERLERSIPPELRQHVVFHGVVDRDRIPALIAGASVCVYPSHMEACPMAWLEAMAMRKAIVASRTGPGPEVIEDGSSGLLCDPHDPQAIADAVVRLLGDADLRARLADGAHRRAAAVFSIESLIDRNVAFYRSAIERRGTVDEREIRTLLVVSHVTHYRYAGRLHAYAPYARELDIWARIFPTVLVAAPCRDAAPPQDCQPLTGRNIEMRPQPEVGGASLAAKVALALRVPSLVASLVPALREADAIHVRCPGNLGLIGAVLAPLFSRHLVAKYAGQWSRFPGEALTTRFQRFVLRSMWWRGPVLVYGGGGSTTSRIVPFFSSALTDAQMQRARAAAAARRTHDGPLRVLFVGRLSRAKNVDVLVDAIAAVAERGVDARCTIVGDGLERGALEHHVERAGLKGRVTFAGSRPIDGVLDCYESADVLVLASETEGWPKAIAEAMAFGVVCVGSNRGLIPWMLGEGRGIVVEPGDAVSLAEALARIARDADGCRAMRDRAAPWAQQHSLESFETALCGVLTSHWGRRVAPETPHARVLA